MNEQAIIDSYNTFVKNGYTKSIEEFKKLIASNPKALEDSYGTFKSVGYTKSIDEYKTLMGVSETPAVEKKNPVVSSATPQEAQPEEQGTTALSSEGTSSASSSQQPPQAQSNAQPQQNVQAQVVIPKPEEDGILSKIGNAAIKAEAATMLGVKKTVDALSGIASNIWSEGFLRPVDDVLNAYKNQLVQSNFFGEDIPDTDKPASDAVKKQLEQLSKKKGGDMSPIDPRAILQGIGNVSSLIINSVLPQEQKTKSITALANASSSIKDQIKSIEDYQQKVAPEGAMKIPYEITKNIAGMAPDLVLAAAMDNPAYAESAAAKWAEITTKKAVPVIEKYSPQAAKAVEKYLPKATKLVKESATSPFTKIMATKGAIKGMAETEEGEDPYVNSLYGALEGAAEGAYMHVLGVTAGEVSPAIAKFISKTGLNSAIATAISNPLANAGVFTSAKALRVAATERRALTTEEIIMEAGTGVGFSLLHAGTIYKNQNEANHYYESVLNDNPINSLGRVINETKANLDVAYDTNLTKDDIQAMMTARDAIKKAILKEPDMQKKKTLGDEAIKLQNKIDAHNTVNDIVEHRGALIDLINNNKSFDANEKKMIIDKISAIADAYDNSAFGTRKRELNTEIMNLDAELSDLSEKFTNSKLPSERASIKAFIDAKKTKLGELNNELTELMTNKQKQDAIQKQTADEALLRAGEERLGLQGVGEGDTKLEITPEQKQAITDEKDAFQEILDNPDNHDEADVQEAKDYFANPIAYYEGKIKFYEEETNPTEDDKASLEYFKKMLEAQKALEPEGTTIQAGGGATVSESTPEVKPEATDNIQKKYAAELRAQIRARLRQEGKSEDEINKLTGTSDSPIINSLTPKDVSVLIQSYKNSKAKQLENYNKYKDKYKPNEEVVPEIGEFISDDTSFWDKKIEELSKLESKPKGTTIQAGGGATATTSGGLTEVTTGGEGTETKTSNVETTAKALEEELNKRKSSVAVKLRRLVGLITHGGEELISKFDFSKIKGGARGRYGKGIYFSNLFKNFDYGNKSTFLKSSGLNLMNADITVFEALQKLSLPSDIRSNISKLETLLSKTKNSKEYNEISEEIERLKSQQKKFDKNSDYIQKALKKAAEKNPAQQFSSFIESLGSNVIESNNLDKMRAVGGLEDSFNNLLLESGFDGINVGDGHEIVIIPQEKIKDLLVSSQEKFISEEYNKAKADGSNPELVNAVEEIIGKPEGTTVTVGTGGATVSEGKPTDVTMAEAPETRTSGIDKLTGYNDAMDNVDFLVPKSRPYVDRDLNKAKDKLKVAKARKDAAKIDEAKKALDKAKAAAEEYKAEVAEKKDQALKELMDSEMYKNADQIQKDALAREVAKRFGERQKAAPSPEKLAGTPKPEPVTMSGRDILKEQVKAFARGSKQGAQGVRDAITQIVDYIKGTNINTKDLTKVMDVLKSKIETEADLNKAIDKVFDIVDKSNEDIIEISKTKVDKDKMKAELEGFKKGKKSVVDRVKQIREYFESVKEFGNLTRKDLSKVMREMSKVKDEKTLDKAVDNINKIIDKAKTDILEISELKMIKEKMKGIKDAKKDLNEKRKLIAAAIDFIQKSGNVSAKKVGKMLRDIGKVNLEDDTKIEKIIEYAEKVFEDAQYDEKLTKANALKKSISKLSSDAKKNVHLTTLGKAFAKLKTSTVDDIDAYIDVASKIKESLVGSKAGDKDNPVRAAEMVNIEESMNYINENMDAQLSKIQEDMAAEVLEKLGVDATGMTIDEMRKMLEEKSDDKKRDQTIIKDGIKKMFDSYTAIIKHIFETGKDPFTGEEMEFDAEQKKLVTEFMGMDLNLLDTKKSLEAMDALSNFLQNGSTAKMEDIVMRYKGERNARIAEAQGLKAKQLRFYFNEWMGRTMAEQIATLPTLTEMLFKSQSKSALFDKLSGLTEMRNKKTLVTTMSTVLNVRYIKQFYDRKANGKDFTDVSNITERGVIAAVKRTMVGTPEQQQAEFNRKKKLIEDSIYNLKRGVETERSLAKIYEKAYDKLLKDSNTVDDVLKKADKNNIDAVDFWVREWDAIYDKLSDVSENIYNQILDRDVNYTPDRYTKLYNKGTPEELAQNTSLFNGNNGSVFKKKTGVLEKIERSEELPKNESDKVSRYLDLSFDKTNVNAMHDALMDINTAGVVRQIESFFKSDAIDRIIPNGEDRAILYNDNNTGRVQDFIRASRNKQIIDSSEAAKAARKLSTLATISTSTALATIFQPLKQGVPVAINTLINTGGKLDFNYFMGPKAEFLNKVGYGISIRGLESQTQIKSINKLVDLAAKSKGAKAMEFIEKANQAYLKIFLQTPDVYIARASWMSYYEKALKKQDIDPKTIDYETHEVNKDAADYAQKMVDRQQNISDRDLNGKLLASNKSGTKLMTSIVMPFASFRLNQFMRATNDIATLTSLNKDASITLADKRAAAASLAGYTAEMAAFKFIAYSASLLMGNITNYIMGKNETEEEKTKRENNLFRGQVTGTITDILSPLPPADILYAKGANEVLGAAQDLMEVNDADKFKLMTTTKSNDFAKSLGVLGIGISKYQNLQDAASLAYSGEFTDEYGRKKYISENDKEALKLVVGLSALANLGLLPADANAIARNAIAIAKRGSSTKPSGGEDQEDKEMNKENKEAATQNKINVLNDMLTNETDVDKKAAIEEKINSLSQDKQDKKDEQELTAQEKADKEALLGGYDSEEDLKRYNKNLYNINFGPNSNWYQEHNYEKMINNELDKKLQKEEDVKNNYYKSDKNPDGTKKRKKKEYSWSKYKKYSR